MTHKKDNAPIHLPDLDWPQHKRSKWPLVILIAVFTVAIFANRIFNRPSEPLQPDSALNDAVIPTTRLPLSSTSTSPITQLSILGQKGGEAINALSFGPHSNSLSSGDWSGVVKKWNVTTGKLQETYPDQDSNVLVVKFDPDENLVAAGAYDQKLKIWVTRDGQAWHNLKGHRRPVLSITISPDGNILASASFNKVKLWSLADGQLLQDLDGVTPVVFSPDGTMVATGDKSGIVKLWQVESGLLLQTIGDSGGIVKSIAFNPNEPILAVGYGDGTMKLWRINDDHLLTKYQGDSGANDVMTFSPDGKLLVASGISGEIQILRTYAWFPMDILRAHDDVRALAFSPDATLLATGGIMGVIRIWGRHDHD